MKITKEDFDWFYSQATGFMRTQILAVAASLRLAEHLRNGGHTAEEFANASGIEPSMALRFLRACTQIGLITCDDSRTFKSTPRLEALHGETPNSMRNKAMVLGTRAQYLIWSEFLAAVRTNQAQAASALGASMFDYYADHPDEAALFRATRSARGSSTCSRRRPRYRKRPLLSIARLRNRTRGNAGSGLADRCVYRNRRSFHFASFGVRSGAGFSRGARSSLP